MTEQAYFFFFCTLGAVAVQGIFALFEMAAVSLSRVRLQYDVAIGDSSAKSLEYLLKKPSRLFGTTLIGVNAALQIGSECARRFYEAIQLDPDWAPLTQIVLVVVFAELAPLFAARRHPEQVSMTLAPFMSLLSKVLFPILWFFDALSHATHRLMGSKAEIPLFLSREEVRMAFEEPEKNEFNEAVGRVFQLKNLTAIDVMRKMELVDKVPSHAKIQDVKGLFKGGQPSFIPIYHRVVGHVVGMLLLRDLLRAESQKRALDYARSPWFVTAKTSILEILDQFRKNNQTVAVLLSEGGEAIGVLTLDQILEEIFGEEKSRAFIEEESSFFVERTLSGEMLVSAFNEEFQARLSHSEKETMSEWLQRSLEHPAVRGEMLKREGFLFVIDEPTLLGVKTFSVRSV